MAQAAIVLATAAYSAYATNEAGKDSQKIAGRNAAVKEAAAADAIERGNEDMMAIRRRTRGLVGKQRAAFASQGIDVSTGSAMDLQDETKALGVIDEATTRKNAFREAWGLNASATNERIAGTYGRRASTSQALGELGTGVARAAPYFSNRPTVAGQE